MQGKAARWQRHTARLAVLIGPITATATAFMAANGVFALDSTAVVLIYLINC